MRERKLTLERISEFDRLEKAERLRKQNTRWLEYQSKLVISDILKQAQNISQENSRRLVSNSVDEILADMKAEDNTRRKDRLERQLARWVTFQTKHMLDGILRGALEISTEKDEEKQVELIMAREADIVQTSWTKRKKGWK